MKSHDFKNNDIESHRWRVVNIDDKSLIPHICHERHEYTRVNLAFSTDFTRKSGVFFTDLTRKIGVFRCKFYYPKILPVPKK